MTSENRIFSLRRARLEDLTEIARLEKRVWKALAPSEAELKRRFLIFPQGFSVAIVGPEVAGCCQGALLWDPPDPPRVDESFPEDHWASGRFLYLFGLTVSPLYRRMGIARALVLRQLETATLRGLKGAFTTCNPQSRELFESLGFLPIQDLSGTFGGQLEKPTLMGLDLEEWQPHRFSREA